MKTINLHLDINETNAVIKALGNLPYAQVHELISKIHSQATEQLTEKKSEEKS